MSEDAIRAARMMQSAADDMQRAASNMGYHVELAQNLWRNEISPELASMISRLEAVAAKLPEKT